MGMNSFYYAHLSASPDLQMEKVYLLVGLSFRAVVVGVFFFF